MRGMRGYKKRSVRRAAARATALGAVVACACGGVALASTHRRKHPHGALATVAAQVVHAERVPKFVAPGPAINAKKVLRGKTILGIPITSAIPFDKAIQQGMAAAVRSAGGHYIEWTNQGTTTEWASGIESGISRHVNLIDLEGGVNPELLVPQIRDARKAGIPVVASMWLDSSQSLPSTLSAAVPDPFLEAGRLMAAWSINATHGHTDALVVIDAGNRSTLAVDAGISKEFKTYCPTCRFRFLNVPFANWATDLETDVEAAIGADPKLNYIIPIYDGMVEFVVPGIAAKHAANRVHIATFNGTPFVLNDIRKGLVAMDVGQPTTWYGDATIGYEMRYLAKKKLPKSTGAPLYMWTKANVKRAGVPAVLGKGYGTAFIPGYRHLWKLHK